MKNSLVTKFATVVLFIGSPVLVYLALPSAISYGILAVLLMALLVIIFVLTLVVLIYRLGRILYFKSLAVAGSAECVIGAIFLSPFSFELKLVLTNLFLLAGAIISRYYAKRKERPAD
jgi:uncharacterized membrane protein